MTLARKPARIAFLVALSVALALGAARAGAQNSYYADGHGLLVRRLTGAIPAGGVSVLRVAARGGNVALHAVAGDSLSYVIHMRARDDAGARALLAAWPVSVRREGNTVIVSVGAGPGRGARGAGIEIGAPARVRSAVLRTGGGNIAVSDLRGDVDARTAGGNIAADNVAGSARLATAGGNIAVQGVGGALMADSGGGDITVGDTAGSASLQSRGGNIAVGRSGGALDISTAAGSIRVQAAAGDVHAATAGGNIDLGAIAGAVTARSGGGNIRVASARRAECQTGGGSLDLAAIAGPVQASTGAGAITVGITASAAEFAASTLRTGSGNIRVLLPAHLPVTVQIELADGPGHHVRSDVPQLQAVAGGAAGMVRARAALNGGGPALLLQGSNTNVTVDRQP